MAARCDTGADREIVAIETDAADDEREGVTPQPPRAAILALLNERAPGAAICPSEAARRVAGDQWRAAMAAELAAEGEVRVTQGGEAVVRPVGAYRIARVPDGDVKH